MSIHFQPSSLTINIIPDSAHPQLTLHCSIYGVALHHESIEAEFPSKVLRLNHEKIKIACQIIGCKATVAKSISDSLLTQFKSLIDALPSQPSQENLQIYTTHQKFFELLRKKLSEHSITKQMGLFDFEIGLSIINQTRPMIVLLGGTSGSGKSTVASLLASKFGISSVLSTDSIRHIMRNFMTTEECPVLFASTYEAGNKIKVEEGTTDRKRVILGFQKQSAIVQERLDSIIQNAYQKGESIIIEGVHLTPDFMASVIAKYHNCIPFLVYIQSEKKHRERFAVRSKYMTLEKKHNKYIQHFVQIREIQKHLTKKADQNLIPKVRNSNIDKSVGIIHRTIIRCLRRVANGESLYDAEKKNAIKIYNQFNEVTKNIWSSETVKQYISSKISQANKVEFINRFLDGHENFDLQGKLEENEEVDIAYQHGNETVHHDGDNDDEKEEGEKDEELKKEIEEEEKKTNAELRGKYKEDLLLQEKEKFDNKKKKFRPEKKSKSSEEGNEDPEEVLDSQKNSSLMLKDDFLTVDEQESLGGSRFAFQKKDSKDEEMEFENIDSAGLKSDKEPLSGNKKEKSKDKKMLRRQMSAGGFPFGLKKSVKFHELEKAISDNKSLTLKVATTPVSHRVVDKFVDYYQKRNPEYRLKYQNFDDRIILVQQSRTDLANSPCSNPELADVVGRVSLSRFSMKNSGTFTSRTLMERRLAGRESGTSEGEGEHSDDGSIISGSLDQNLHLTAIGSNLQNLSDHMVDFSDDFDSTARFDNEEDSEGRTSLEIGANSISEQTDEDEDEEDVDLITPQKFVVKV